LSIVIASRFITEEPEVIQEPEAMPEPEAIQEPESKGEETVLRRESIHSCRKRKIIESQSRRRLEGRGFCRIHAARRVDR